MTNSVKELVEAAKNIPMDRCAENHHNRLRAAISAVESEGDGWIEIKEGCEMPPTDGRSILVCRIWGHITYAPTSAHYGTYHPNAKGKETWRDASGVKIDFTHYQPLPAPPTKEK